MGYNTNAELRSIAGMSALVPTETVLNHWVSLIRYLISRYESNPDIEAAKIIEANRISTIYWNLKHSGEDAQMKAGIEPLSDAEKELINGIDTGVDSIPINGKRSSEINRGRR